MPNHADVVHVFTDRLGEHGNPLGIVVDQEGQLGADERVKVAASLGFSESVFIDSIDERRISIYTQTNEIAFAGHAAVGAAWFLERRLGTVAKSLRGLKGEIATWSEDDLFWVRTELRTTPPWWHERLDSPEVVEALTGPQSPLQAHTQVWAWDDEPAGTVRSRTFAPDWGIVEDEANGSGCMRLAACLGRRLTILHGVGSVLHARPGGPGLAEVGGTVSEKGTVSL